MPPCPDCGKRLSQSVPSCCAAGMLACQPEINTAACHFINILTRKTRGRFTADTALSGSCSATGAPTHPAEHPCRGSAAVRGLWVPPEFALYWWGRIGEILLTGLRGLKRLGWAEEGSVPSLSSAISRTRHRGRCSRGLWGGNPISCSARRLVCTHR